MSRPVVATSERCQGFRRRFAADARGATSIEYALIAGLIFIVVVGSLRLYATKVSGVYTTIGNAISQN